MSYYIICFFVMGIGMFVQWKLKSKFRTFSQQALSSGLTGKQIAEQMLAYYQIYDVQVTSVSGSLTDHYNPITKTVHLSESVYLQSNAAAAAVAAHECGHAVQHATAYFWLGLRSKIVPMIGIVSNMVQWVLMIGILIFSISNNPIVLLIGTILFGITTLFAFITLPVEIDASKRALQWIDNNAIVNESEYKDSQSALKWAAYTYVVAAFGSLITLFYYLSLLLGNRNDE